MINYDLKTGIFTWPDDLKNQSAGKQAGAIYKKGYRYIMVDGKRWMAHRLAWFLATGKLPKNQIDHINGNKDDNRFVNLREAVNSENKRNAGLGAKNTSGYKCVSRGGNKWVVTVKFPGAKKQKYCGRFFNIIDAAVCANYHIAHGHGDFARLNKIPEGKWSHD